LRLIVVDQQRVNDAVLKQLGARGMIRPSANALQVVVGPQADQVASDIRAQLRMSSDHVSSNDIAAPVVSQPVVATHSPHVEMHVETQGVLAALGGAANIGELVLASSRLCLRLRDAGKLDAEGAQRAGCRAIARVGVDAVHLLIGPAAAGLYADLKKALGPSEAVLRT
jgi:PTS system N-acetylglucosamine-specific IIC component